MPHRRAQWLVLALLATGCALVLLGAGVGSTGFQSVLNAWHDPLAWQIVWDIRLPRTLGAWMAGALLGLAGAVAQGLFRNPLGRSVFARQCVGRLARCGLGAGAVGGVGCGHALAGAAGADRRGIRRRGWAGVLFTLVLAQGVQHTLRLLLAGVIVGFVLGAVKDLVGLAAPDILAAMQAFNLGSTGFVGWSACVLMAVVWLLCQTGAWSLSRVLDGLTLGESTAQSLGLPLAPLRALLVLVLALATGTAVAQTGLIAFVGLAAPHLARSLVKTTHAWLLVLASLMGGALLLSADILARWVIAPQELPVGVLTAVLGGSYLLVLMHKRSNGRSML